MASYSIGRRVFMVFHITPSDGYPIGTAFGVLRPGLVLTAHHVVEGIEKANLIVCCTAYSELLNKRVERIVSHRAADIAALILEPDERLEHFELATPREGFDEHPIGEDVLSYGFPPLEKPVRPRMMKGHIQCKFQHKEDGYDYRAFELAFPSFPGQSGSPVFSDWDRNRVMGLVTCSTTYASKDEGDASPSAYGSWALGASLTPLAGWIDSIT